MGRTCLFSPTSPMGFKGKGGVELTSRLGVIDVSIKDIETWSVTDIFITEIFWCLLPGLWWWRRETFTAVLYRMEMGQNGGKIATPLIQALSFLSSQSKLCLICLCLIPVADSLSACLRLCSVGGFAIIICSRYKSPPSALQCSTRHSPCREKRTCEMPWMILCGEEMYGYVIRLVFREQREGREWGRREAVVEKVPMKESWLWMQAKITTAIR